MSIDISVDIVSLLRELIEVRKISHREVSEYLQHLFNRSRGFSARTIRRLCATNNIHTRSIVDDSHLDRLIRVNVAKVGRHYGRKMMSGLLRSQGWYLGENRVGNSMQRVNPNYHNSRRVETNRQINPVPYIANYFGHKLHIDQNEKIVMFGVTHVLAVDGFSGKIVSLVSMPVKNCALIYEHVYMKLAAEYGLWDTLRVDHGTEWALILYIQNMLSNHRNDPSRRPYIQTSSRQNHTVERLWVEVNNRVNYPIKNSLINIIEDEQLDLNSPANKYCVSWCTLRVANVGLKILVESWNNHPLPRRVNLIGQGSPNYRMMIDKRVKKIPTHLLPSTSEAMHFYRVAGGSITDEHEFGVDPLSGNMEKQQTRQEAFLQQFHFEHIFHALVNGNDTLFKEALLFFSDITFRLSAV